MINGNLIPLTFFIPFIILTFLYLKTYYKYAQLYRRKKNPDFPLLAGEAKKYFAKDPINYIKRMPIYPFLMWKIIFESHKDPDLDKQAHDTRKYFYIFLFGIIGDFVIHILAISLNLFSI